MGVSRVIQLHLLIVVCCIFVLSKDIRDLNRTLVADVANRSVAVEGGPSIVLPKETTHEGREHMIKVSHTKVSTQEALQKKTTTQLPAYVMGQKNDNKTSVPKKDATLVDTRNTTSSTTTTTIPPKPTLTIGEDEEPPKKSNDTTKHGFSIESVIEKSKKTDYVVPIVVVILSVPLVAIIFSVLYKRGADWWQHRHYRRMDFLINGMYDN